jgi:hypothetical protein
MSLLVHFQVSKLRVTPAAPASMSVSFRHMVIGSKAAVTHTAKFSSSLQRCVMNDSLVPSASCAPPTLSAWHCPRAACSAACGTQHAQCRAPSGRTTTAPVPRRRVSARALRQCVMWRRPGRAGGKPACRRCPAVCARAASASARGSREPHRFLSVRRWNQAPIFASVVERVADTCVLRGVIRGRSRRSAAAEGVPHPLQCFIAVQQDEVTPLQHKDLGILQAYICATVT